MPSRGGHCQRRLIFGSQWSAIMISPFFYSWLNRKICFRLLSSYWFHSVFFILFRYFRRAKLFSNSSPTVSTQLSLYFHALGARKHRGSVFTYFWITLVLSSKENLVKGDLMFSLDCDKLTYQMWNNTLWKLFDTVHAHSVVRNGSIDSHWGRPPSTVGPKPALGWTRSSESSSRARPAEQEKARLSRLG